MQEQVLSPWSLGQLGCYVRQGMICWYNLWRYCRNGSGLLEGPLNQDQVNNDLAVIASKFHCLKLALNIKKAHLIIFSAKMSLVYVYLHKFMGKSLLKFINQNSWMWLLTRNWAGKIYMYTIPVKSAVIICHYVELKWGSVIWDMWVLLYGTSFLVFISIQTQASLFPQEVLKHQSVITNFNQSCVHVLLM